MLQRSFPYLVWLELRAYLVSSTLSNAIAIECSSLYISKMTTYLTANPYRQKKEPSTRRKERLELGLSEGCIEGCIAEYEVNGFWCRPCRHWVVDKSMDWQRVLGDHLAGTKHRNKIKKWRRDKADNDAAASGSYQAIRKTAEALAKANENKGFIIPRGTALLIEQCAILKDATNQYMLNLYMKAGFRSRL